MCIGPCIATLFLNRIARSKGIEYQCTLFSRTPPWIMQQTSSEQLPRLENSPCMAQAAGGPKTQQHQLDKCTAKERSAHREEGSAETEQLKQTKTKVQRLPRMFEDSDFAYIDQELPAELFEAFKATFVGKQVPEQSISNERLRELGFEGPDDHLWLRCCIERKLAYW